MSDPSDIFSQQTGFTTYSTNLGSEIDLRSEFDYMINGGDGFLAHGQYFILRRMRRNTEGVIMKCVCRDSFTNEPGRDYGSCAYCLGEGNLFDEEIVRGYRQIITSAGTDKSSKSKHAFGVVFSPATNFYLSYDIAPTVQDKIITLRLDRDGRVLSPISREEYYEINLVRDLRSDQGRVEYTICHTEKISPPTQGSF